MSPPNIHTGFTETPSLTPAVPCKVGFVQKTVSAEKLPKFEASGRYVPVDVNVHVPGLDVIPLDVWGHHTTAWILDKRMQRRLKMAGIVFWMTAAAVTLLSL